MADPAPSGRLEHERLLAVRDRLGDRDWRSITTADLAEASGLSRMTLHRRGVTKDGVLVQLATLLAQDYRDAVYPALSASGPAPDRLRTALEGVCAVDERALGLIDALGDHLPEVFHDPGDGPVLTRATFTDGLRRILEDGAREGTLTVPDPAESATLLFNAAGWTYRHLRTGHRWPEAKARDAVVGLLVQGVCANPTTRAHNAAPAG